MIVLQSPIQSGRATRPLRDAHAIAAEMCGKLAQYFDPRFLGLRAPLLQPLDDSGITVRRLQQDLETLLEVLDRVQRLAGLQRAGQGLSFLGRQRDTFPSHQAA